jgi:hypothetical protein
VGRHTNPVSSLGKYVLCAEELEQKYDIVGIGSSLIPLLEMKR